MIHREPQKPYRKFLGRAPADNHPPYKFAYSRCAIKYGLQSLGLIQGDQILVPEMACDVLIEPLTALNIQATYFAVKADLSPDWNDVQQKLNTKTKALVMIHYFGIPQDIQHFIDFCKIHHLFLIEDNSHGFGGQQNGQELGTFGDIGVSSPRKTLPLFNGAYLFQKNTLPVVDMKPLGLEPIHLWPRQIKSWIRISIEKWEFLRKLVIQPVDYCSQELFRSIPQQTDWRMDAKTQQTIEKQDLEAIKVKRQKIYHIWQQWSQSENLCPVFANIPQQCIPMAYPAYCNTQDWEQWFTWGYQHGIEIFSWPTFPVDVWTSNSKAPELWKTMLCFPINQDIDADALSKFLSKLKFTKATGNRAIQRYYDHQQSVQLHGSLKGLLPKEEIAFAQIPKCSNILDIGCGAGRTSNYFQSNGHRVIALDISSALIKTAKRSNSEVAYLVGDACCLSFKENQFDVVVFSNNGIDYINPYQERLKALTEIKKVLKPGGLFIFSAHNNCFPRDRDGVWPFIKSWFKKNRSTYIMDNHYAWDTLKIFLTTPSIQTQEVQQFGFELQQIIPRKLLRKIKSPTLLGLLDSYVYYIFTKYK